MSCPNPIASGPPAADSSYASAARERVLPVEKSYASPRSLAANSGEESRRERAGAVTAAEVDEEILREDLDKAEKVASVFGRKLRFNIQKEANLVQIEVLDAEQDKVIRKIPPDQVVRMVERLNEMVGALWDAEA
jgi:uncharacterized FlaG/YvyC family protein